MTPNANSNVIEEAGWKFHWRLTESAGIMVYLADYKGRRVLWEGSLPYVTIDHQRSIAATTVGEEDAAIAAREHGPWWIPLGTRTLASSVRVQPFRGGVELSANFAAGPYNYMQLWRFHDDGRLCPWLTVYGSGVHDQHTYHPHWRFDFDLDGAQHDALERYEDGRWQRIDEEGWFPYGGEADDHGNVWRQVDFDSGAALNIRPHTWDDAEMFAIRYHDGEWAPYSPRAEATAQPFPAAYVGHEALDGEDVTVWYVAHVHYDQSFPYTAGPWLKVEGF
jgi:Cu2+-containing amine oxidase